MTQALIIGKQTLSQLPNKSSVAKEIEHPKIRTFWHNKKKKVPWTLNPEDKKWLNAREAEAIW